MPHALEMTLLAENTARRQGLLAEHGLAYWIRCGEHQVLFDTGQGLVLEHNARNLGINLAQADAIVLSHGHYDHTGGLSYALAASPDAPLFAHPDAFAPKYSRKPDGHVKSASTPDTSLNALDPRRTRFRETTEPTEIVPGLVATGAIPRTTDYEDTGGDFYLDPQGQVPDPLTDDQALYCDTHDGLVVLLGCAHAGVVNTLRYIEQLVPGRPVRALIGGMHLLHASPRRIEATFEELAHRQIALLAPTHCTGEKQTALMWQRFPTQVREAHVGNTFTFRN